ncbi:MAG TPA: hypothetical protein VFQ61_31430 [Polyangiaceae bacterium]|nr:hypothetical protein [Polyangiaceae bacterium]
MKPESSIDELVDALRADLPSPRDEARVRARLAAVGVSVGAGVTAGGAAAAPITKALLPGAKLAAKLYALPLTIKASVVGVASVSAVVTPLWLASQAREMHRAAPSTVSSSSALSKAAVTRQANGDVLASKPTPAPPATQPPTDSPPDRSPKLTQSSPEPKRPLGAPRAPSVALEPRSRSGLRSANEEPAALLPRSPGNSAATHAVIAVSRSSVPVPTTRPDVTAPSSITAEPTQAIGTATFAQVEPAAAPSPVQAPKLTTASGSESSLREETALVDTALIALRDGDRSKARLLLETHARRFPHGLLARERERARRKLLQASGSDSTH